MTPLESFILPPQTQADGAAEKQAAQAQQRVSLAQGLEVIQRIRSDCKPVPRSVGERQVFQPDYLKFTTKLSFLSRWFNDSSFKTLGDVIVTNSRWDLVERIDQLHESIIEFIEQQTREAISQNRPEMDWNTDILLPAMIKTQKMIADNNAQEVNQPEISVRDTLLQNIIAQAEIFQVFGVHDGLPFRQYALKPELRDDLISPRLLAELKSEKSWNLVQFRELAEGVDARQISILMKAATKDSFPLADKALGVSVNLEPPADQAVLGSLRWSHYGKTEKSLHKVLSLPAPDTIASATQLAVYNHDGRDHTIRMPDGKDINLRPLSGMIFEVMPATNTRPQYWCKRAHYSKNRAMIETNPLVRIDGPIISDAPAKPADQSVAARTKGEYFLTGPMLQVLSKSQSPSSHQLDICTNEAGLKRALKKSFKKSPVSDVALSLALYDSGCEHFIPVRVLRRGDQVAIYMHETLGRQSRPSAGLRSLMQRVAGQYFVAEKVYCLAPENQIQLDFSSCGVSLLKAVRAFEKNPELDEWVWQQCKNPEAMVWDSNETAWSAKKSKKDDTSEEVDKGCFIPLSDIPAKLLKCYQGPREELSADQLGTLVSKRKNMSLEQYLNFFRSSDERTANLAPMAKRYQYFIDWELNNSESPQEVVKSVSLKEQAMNPEADEKTLLKFFKPALGKSTQLLTNSWLTKNCPACGQLSTHDWEMICTLEDFVFNQKPSREVCVQLQQWLSRIGGASANVARQQFLKAVCFYIRKYRRSYFQGSSIAGLQGKIQDYLDQKIPPVRFKRKQTCQLKVTQPPAKTIKTEKGRLDPKEGSDKEFSGPDSRP